VLAEQIGFGAADYPPKRQGGDDDVLGVAQDGDEVWHEVNRQEHITDQYGQANPDPLRYGRVGGKSLEEVPEVREQFQCLP
jgi:hypothetical protein